MKNIIELITSKPIYSTIKVEKMERPSSLNNIKFDYYCEQEKGIKTFLLIGGIESMSSRQKLTSQLKGYDPLHDFNGNYSTSQHYVGRCLSCEKYRIDFLLQFHSNYPVPKSHGKSVENEKNYITKIGQNPKASVKLDSQIRNYLDEDNIKLYEKGLMCLHNGFGIGSFGYLRRVAECEIKKIVNSIAEIDDERKKRIDELKSKHEESRQFSKFYKGIHPYLPNSLKVLGNNPLELLYNSLSSGIHHGGMTEEECLEKANAIDQLFQFIIRKLYEENSEIKEIRKIIKGLE